MDASPMVATDGGDVNKLKDGLNKEDAMSMVEATMTSRGEHKNREPKPKKKTKPKKLRTECSIVCSVSKHQKPKLLR